MARARMWFTEEAVRAAPEKFKLVPSVGRKTGSDTVVRDGHPVTVTLLLLVVNAANDIDTKLTFVVS